MGFLGLVRVHPNWRICYVASVGLAARLTSGPPLLASEDT